jgi:hypothetical protein
MEYCDCGAPLAFSPDGVHCVGCYEVGVPRGTSQQNESMGLTCAKCEKPVDVATYALYHGCCSQACDEDEGICLMVALPPWMW